jgi:cytochrome bd ubiquinol oxidase subunit II
MFDSLALIWAGLLGFAMLAYLVLDGFDLGVGIVFPFLGSPKARLNAMHTLAPTWDGNETWLVLAIGSLLAAFPLAYSIILPALYIPLTAMVLALVFRGVAFEFVDRKDRLNRFWLVGFGAGSLIAAAMQGMMLGAVLQGITVHGRSFGGGPWDWLSPLLGLTGATLIAVYATHGAAWLLLRDAIVPSLRGLLLGAAGLSILGVGNISYQLVMATALSQTGWVGHTALGILLAGFAAVAVILFALGLRGRRGGLCFAATTIAIAIGLVALVARVFPFLIPPSLTILDAAAPDASLGFLLVGAAVLLPLILAYTAFTYWVFLREERAETK